MKDSINLWKAAAAGWDRHKRAISLIIAAELIVAVAAFFCTQGVYAAQEYWQIEAGGHSVAMLKSESQAKEAVTLLKKSYKMSGSENLKVNIEPEVQIEKKYYGIRDKAPDTQTPEQAAALLKSVKKDGKPLLMVTATQTVEEKNAIDFDTVKSTSDKLAINTVHVKNDGQKGETTSTVKKTSINGNVVGRDIVDSEITAEAEDRVVVEGTRTGAAQKGEYSTQGGSEYSASTGQAVADFALKYVGNPYVYGGSSLTNGADCSGFVMAVYGHYGIGLPHDAGADRQYGKEVSINDAQPGDLVCYPGHIGIYIGNGQIVHAMNESHGICVSNIHYSGKPILTVRRLLG